MRGAPRQKDVTARRTLAVFGSVAALLASGLAAAPPAATPADLATARPRQVVWVALEGQNQVAKVNLRTRRVVRRRSVPGAPHNITANAAGTVAAALWGDRRIALVRDGKVVPVGLGGAPHDVKIGDGRVVVANQGDARLDIVWLNGRRGRSIGLTHDPHDVALTRDGERAWLSLEGSDNLAVVNLVKKKVARYVSTGKRPHDLLFAPDGRLWVTDWNGAIHVFSRRGRLLKSRSLGEEAHHLAFTPGGGEVWITDHARHAIFVVSTRTLQVKKRLSLRGAPHHIAITPDGKKAVVADHDRGLVIVYRVPTRSRFYKLRVGRAPHGVWAIPRR